MATANSLIDETLDLLLGSIAEKQTTLSGAINSSVTSLVMTESLQGFQPGALLEVDMEVMRVTAFDSASNTATVIRAMRGSTAASHSAGALVTLAPKFTRHGVFRALNSELYSLANTGLFRMRTNTFTYNAAVIGYELDVDDIIDVYEVRYQDVGPAIAWPRIPLKGWSFNPNADTTDFPSGKSINVRGPAQPGRKIIVTYKASFGQLTDGTTDPNSDTVGLPTSANDLLALGAGLRLIFPREVGRNFFETQGDTRRPDEVGAGAQTQAGLGWSRVYARRLKEELDNLARQYPAKKF